MDITANLLSPSERDRVLRAMASLCAEQGYAETTVAQVVERSGVPLESFQAMFADKEQCATAIVNVILAEVVATVSSTYSPDLAERDSYLLGMKAILELLAAQPALAHISFICARQMGPLEMRDGLETGSRLLSAMLERLWSESESETQPSQAARAALGGGEALVRREIVCGRVEQLPRLLPDFVYVATVPFLGQEEALRLTRRARELLAGSAWG